MDGASMTATSGMGRAGHATSGIGVIRGSLRALRRLTLGARAADAGEVARVWRDAIADV